MEYKKTGYLLHIMQILGHKSLRYVLIYTQLIDFQNDDFVCRTAKTVQEAYTLIEGGFDFVTDMEGIKLFRRRK